MTRPKHRKPGLANARFWYPGTGGKHKVGVPAVVWFTPYQRCATPQDVRDIIASFERRFDEGVLRDDPWCYWTLAEATADAASIARATDASLGAIRTRQQVTEAAGAAE